MVILHVDLTLCLLLHVLPILIFGRLQNTINRSANKNSVKLTSLLRHDRNPELQHKPWHQIQKRESVPPNNDEPTQELTEQQIADLLALLASKLI